MATTEMEPASPLLNSVLAQEFGDDYGDYVLLEDEEIEAVFKAMDKLADEDVLRFLDDSWVNDTARWMETDPVLVTSYSVMALEIIQSQL